MKIAVDTNVLVRAAVKDDPRQARAAAKVLSSASVIAVAIPCLCEFVWVLQKVYGFDTTDISTAIRALLAATNVHTDRAAAEAGLTALAGGGDFADGVIAHEGRMLGGEVFVSFDKAAVSLMKAQTLAAQLLR